MNFADPRRRDAKSDSCRTRLTNSSPRRLRFHCISCGAEFIPKRSTRLYCTDRCRKARDRAAANPPDATDYEIRDQLVARRLVGQVWPVYRWDNSPSVQALLVPLTIAASELGISEDRLSSLLRRFGIAKDEVERQHIEKFHADRKDRRIQRDEAAYADKNRS